MATALHGKDGQPQLYLPDTGAIRKAGAGLRRVRIASIDGANDLLYIKGLVEGLPREGTISRAELDALPNQAAKMRALALALASQDDQQRRSRYGDLLGEVDIETPGGNP